MRVLVLLSLIVAAIVPLAPARAGTLPPLIVSERLYAWDGHWVPADWKQVPNSQTLRVVVQVSTRKRVAPIAVTLALRHVSWHLDRRVVESADFQVRLRPGRQRGHFEALFHVPVTHPLQFSDVVVDVTAGTLHRVVTSGITLEPPLSPAQARVTLTVSQAFAFCAARPHRLYDNYGLAVRGYISYPPFNGSDGPNSFFMRSSPGPFPGNITQATRQHLGFLAGGFVSPRNNAHVTLAGHLDCFPNLGFGVDG